MFSFRHYAAGAVAAFLFLVAPAWAAPGLINYSGRLIDGGGFPVTTAVPVQFTFWDAAAAGTQLGGGYVYSRSITPNMDGLYSVEIGDMTTTSGAGGIVPGVIFDAPAVWLNVQINGEDLAPRARITSVGYAFRADSTTTAAVALEANHAVLADQSATSSFSSLADSALSLKAGSFITAPSTGTAVENGAALLVAYQRAKALTPNQVQRNFFNRAALVVPPGRYDIGSAQLTLDVDYLDLIGLSTARDNQFIVGTTNGPGTGVIRQMANDVHIENLAVWCNSTSGIVTYDANCPTVYYPDSNTTSTIVKNCEFRASAYTWGMRLGTNYPGTFTNCIAGVYAFGGNYGTASGTFTNCIGGSDSFGGSYGTASGTFVSCTGYDRAFAGGYGTASGTFTNCNAKGFSFGSGNYNAGTGGFTGRASGIFTNCVGGNSAFGAGSNASASGGRFYYCRGDQNSFGSGAAGMYYCVNNYIAVP